MRNWLNIQVKGKHLFHQDYNYWTLNALVAGIRFWEWNKVTQYTNMKVLSLKSKDFQFYNQSKVGLRRISKHCDCL